MTSRSRIHAAIALAMAMMAIATAQAGAETSFQVRGAGFGHGVGMSQWGAYGFAEHGRDYRDIATHYYAGTKLGQVADEGRIRVLLDTTAAAVSFTGSKRACGHDLKPAATYRVAVEGAGVRLESSEGTLIAGCGENLVAKGVSGPIGIGDEGTYRGDFVAAASGGRLYVVNEVGLDDYVQGVVPNEMPAAWPLAALQAQAVAARSYALATDAGSGIFDAYDDTRSQVYGGLASETSRTNRAVRKSRLQVLLYDGEVIPAFFSSSSGGRTENVEFGFPGAEPQPYLKSVEDPYDDASPDHRWSETFTRSEMESKLDGLVKGSFEGIEVTKRGVTPRIVEAKIVGSGGATKVTGSDLQVRLGLRSSWAKFKRLP